MSEERAVYAAEQEVKPVSVEEIEAALGEPKSEFTFSVTLLPDVLLRAKLIQDATEGVRIQQKCEAFGKLFKSRRDKEGKVVQNLPPGPIKERWENQGVTEEIAYQSAFLSEMLIEPAVTKMKALEWAKTRGMLFAELYLACNTMGRSQEVAGEIELLDEEKND